MFFSTRVQQVSLRNNCLQVIDFGRVSKPRSSINFSVRNSKKIIPGTFETDAVFALSLIGVHPLHSFCFGCHLPRFTPGDSSTEPSLRWQYPCFKHLLVSERIPHKDFRLLALDYIKPCVCAKHASICFECLDIGRPYHLVSG